MKAFKNIAVTIVIVTAIFCLAQISPIKHSVACNKSHKAVALPINDAEDFSLVNLLTLKFM